MPGREKGERGISLVKPLKFSLLLNYSKNSLRTHLHNKVHLGAQQEGGQCIGKVHAMCQHAVAVYSIKGHVVDTANNVHNKVRVALQRGVLDKRQKPIQPLVRDQHFPDIRRNAKVGQQANKLQRYARKNVRSSANTAPSHEYALQNVKRVGSHAVRAETYLDDNVLRLGRLALFLFRVSSILVSRLLSRAVLQRRL